MKQIPIYVTILNMKENKSKSILFILVLISIILLVTGYIQVLDLLKEEDYGYLMLGYRILQNFLVEGNTEEIQGSLILIIGSFLAPLSLASSVLISLFEAGNKTILSIYIKLYFRDHLVVAGENLDSQQLISSNISNNKRRIVLIVNNLETVPNYIVENRNILIIKGDIEEKRIWKSSSIHKAKSVIISLNNVDRAPYISEMIELLCKKHIPEIHIGLRNSDQSMVINDTKNMLSMNPRLNKKIKSFSLQGLSAIALLEQHSLHNYYKMDVLTTSRVHIVIYGFTNVTDRVLLELLHLYIYPNREKILITFVNSEIDPIENFLRKYPGFNNFADYLYYTESEFIRILRNTEENPLPNKPLQYLFFLENSWEIPKVARNIRRFELVSYGSANTDIPLLFMLPDDDEYPAIHKSYSKHYRDLGLKVVGESDYVTLESILESEKVYDSIAKNIHNSYRELYDIEPWDELTEREKDFNRRSARHYSIKLAYIGLKIVNNSKDMVIKIPKLTEEQILNLAEMEHRRLSTEKYLDDFIYITPNKSYYTTYRKSLRLHSDLIPFAKLTKKDIDKDINTFRDWEKTLQKVLINKKLKEI